MNKQLLVYICIVVLGLFGWVVLLNLSINPEDSISSQSRITPLHPTKVFPGVDSPRYATVMNLIAGICAQLLVGYLFWVIYLKYKKDSRADQSARDNSLYNISLSTGRTEYELFCKSAEGWSVTGDRIDEDFKKYIADQILPYYARDFVRKNHEHLDESLIKKETVTLNSFWDWAIALLVFPGSFLLLVLLVLFFGKR